MLLALLAAAQAIAAAAPAAPPLVTPDWLHRPTGQEIGNAYPYKAALENHAGRVVLHCLVSPDGAVHDCTTPPGSVAPQGEGFEQAAMSLVRYFRMQPNSGGSIKIPVQFRTNTSGPPPQSSESMSELKKMFDLSGEPPLIEIPETSSGMDAAASSTASTAGISGAAVLICSVSSDHRATECTWGAEIPEAAGLAQAALARAAKQRIIAPDDIPVGNKVRLLFRFSKPSR